MRAISLLYHDVVERDRFDESGRKGATQNRFKMPPALFEAHLNAVERGPSRPQSLRDVLEVDHSAGMPVLLTFDDGGHSAFSHIAGRLENRGWPGHFFVIGDQIDKDGFLTPGEIRELHRRGHIIGTHSYSHPRRMSHLSEGELVDEWRLGRRSLSDILGEEVVIGSVPGGFYTRKVARAAAAAGLRYLFTSEPTTRTRQVDGCLVFGRYALFGDSPAEMTGRFASGERLLRYRQWAFWNFKKALKKVGGRGYLWLRQQIIEHRGGGR